MKTIAYPPGAVRSSTELKVGMAFWRVAPSLPLESQFIRSVIASIEEDRATSNNGSGVRFLVWNVNGPSLNPAFLVDFIFTNYWYAYAYYQRAKVERIGRCRM